VLSLAWAAALVTALDGVRFLRWKALTYTGLISYGLYLLHQPVNWAVHFVPGLRNWQDPRVLLVSFVVVYVVSALSWELFEKRFVQYGHRWRYEPEPTSPSIVPGVAPSAPPA
jgi:peptidoglycan/LPS O-acetylase OafA/YrhL